MGQPTVNQTHYQFQDDGSDANTSTLLGSEDTPNTGLSLDTTYFMRIKVSNTGAKEATSYTYQLQYNVDGAGWVAVTTTSNNVRALAGSDTDGDSMSTERLTNDGGTYTNGVYEESGITPAFSLGFAPNETELVYAIQFRSADLTTGSEQIDLRLTNGALTLDNYNVTAEATMPAGAADKDIAAAITTAVTVAADVNAPGKLESANDIALSVAAAINAKGELAAPLSTALSVAADVQDSPAAGALYFPVKVPWTRKPPPGTPIDKSSPFVRDMFFFSALDRNGDQVDLVNNNIGVTDISGSATVVRKITKYGLVQDFEYTNPSEWAGFNFGNTGGSGAYEPTELTIIARARPEDEVDGGGSRIVSKRTQAIGADDYAIYLGATKDFWAFRINDSNDDLNPGGLGDFDNILFDLALAVDSNGQDNYAWTPELGGAYSLLAQTGATVDTGSGDLCIGFRQAEDRHFDGEVHYVAMWGVKKDEPFINAFRANPWQIFQPRTVWYKIGAAAAGDDIAAALSLTMSVAADLDAIGALTSAQAIALTVAADLDAQGKIETAAAIALSVAADIKGAGELDAALALQMSVLADLDALGQLGAATALALSVAADITASGKLEAATNIVFTLAANITDAGGVDLVAALSTALALTPNLNAPGTLAAAPLLTLSAAMDLSAHGKLEAANTLLLQLAADLDATGQLTTTAALALTTAANLTAQGKIEAAFAISMTVAAAVTGADNPDIAANPSISLVATPDISAQGKLEASNSFSLSLIAGLSSVSELTVNPTLSLSAIADLDAAGQVAAVLPLALSVAADVNAPGELAAAANIIISVAADVGSGDVVTNRVSRDMIFQSARKLVAYFAETATRDVEF